MLVKTGMPIRQTQMSPPIYITALGTPPLITLATTHVFGAMYHHQIVLHPNDNSPCKTRRFMTILLIVTSGELCVLLWRCVSSYDVVCPLLMTSCVHSLWRHIMYPLLMTSCVHFLWRCVSIYDIVCPLLMTSCVHCLWSQVSRLFTSYDVRWFVCPLIMTSCESFVHLWRQVSRLSTSYDVRWVVFPILLMSDKSFVHFLWRQLSRYSNYYNIMWDFSPLLMMSYKSFVNFISFTGHVLRMMEVILAKWIMGEDLGEMHYGRGSWWNVSLRIRSTKNCISANQNTRAGCNSHSFI